MDPTRCDYCTTDVRLAEFLVSWDTWVEQSILTTTVESYVCHRHLMDVLERAGMEPDLPCIEIVRM